MSGPDDVPPNARGALESIAATPTAPAKFVVIGGMGTGKTATLTAIRSALRAAGVAVLTRPPSSPQDGQAALVIDDAHLLGDDELAALDHRMTDPAATLVVATEPYQHHPGLRALTLALERENPAVSLGALPPAELQRLVTAAVGGPPPAEIGRALMPATAGLPLLVRAALAALRADGAVTPAALAQAARFALIDRLRTVDEAVLDALLIVSLSPDLAAADVAAALDLPATTGRQLVDRARGSGLVEPSHSPLFLRSVHRAVAQVVGAARHREIENALLSSQVAMSTLSDDLALRLSEHGMRDERLAGILTRQAELSAGQPAQAARLYRAAVDAGAVAQTAHLADALARTADCTTAAKLSDELLTSDDDDDRAAAVRIAASIAAHDGSAVQAAELFRWLGPQPDAFVGAAGAVVLVGDGDPDAAREALTANGLGPPTTATRAARSLAEGLLLTLDQPFTTAIGRLGQSLIGEQSAKGVTPDTPAALVTLVALHGGDPVRARSIIGRAVRAGGDEFVVHRHRLLQAWVKMLDGQLASAAVDAAGLSDTALHARDALWLAALQTGIARRTGDGGALQKHWYQAMEVLAEYSVDLYSLLPLGELWMAAGRLRQVDRLRHSLDQGFGLLARLGNPALWSVPLHWSGVHAGILTNSPEAVAPHGQALTAAAATSALARAVANAGRVWLRVLANHVDVGDVTAAARGLSEHGLTWDATRLASQAALQTPDSRVSGAMLQLARDLKTTSVDSAAFDSAPVDSGPVDSGTPAGELRAEPQATPSRSSASARLSEREREVAELLLLGMPYRDIGAQLFISAKTVEHHVARIRRRLGAESRSELLSMLRAMLSPAN